MASHRRAEQHGASLPPEADDLSLQGHWARHPLADEHAVLLDEVRFRERAVRGALGAGRWPAGELDALVAYLRYEVLDQAVTEERLLFPQARNGVADSRIHGLTDDHVRIRDLTGQLAGAADADGSDREPGVLVGLLDDLEELLEHHMHTEQAVLSAATSDGVEALRQPFRCHRWFPLTEGPELDLDVLPWAFAHQAALERLSRLRPGESVRVRSGSELQSLWSTLAWRQPGEFGWAYLEEGPERWRAEITRRAPN
jgi:uncharacterized protein (DUF2249 family)